jgi:hypothetical protein
MSMSDLSGSGPPHAWRTLSLYPVGEGDWYSTPPRSAASTHEDELTTHTHTSHAHAVELLALEDTLVYAKCAHSSRNYGVR